MGTAGNQPWDTHWVCCLLSKGLSQISHLFRTPACGHILLSPTLVPTDVYDKKVPKRNALLQSLDAILPGVPVSTDVRIPGWSCWAGDQENTRGWSPSQRLQGDHPHICLLWDPSPLKFVPRKISVFGVSFGKRHQMNK